MSQALVTPRLIEWARKRCGLSQVEAADLVKVSARTLAAWESNDAHPTLLQAQTLANRLSVPLGYFYLASPPEEGLQIPDLRVPMGAEARTPSPNFFEVLDDVIRKQAWYRENLEEQQAEPLPFVGKFGRSDLVETIAADIRETLAINDDMREAARTWQEFFTSFVRRAEGAGILVFRNGVVGNNTHASLDFQEFRGFALSDNLAPAVFINTTDYKTSQIFTLAHELAHLWIAESGVSNPNYELRSTEQTNDIDKICDAIAAETLVPKEEFEMRWRVSTPVVANLRALARDFRVSSFVILRRAYQLELIPGAMYRRYYGELLGEIRPRRKDGDKKSRGDFFNNFFARNGGTLPLSVVAAVGEGRLSSLDAARLLNVKVKTLKSVQARLFGSVSANA